MKGSGKERERVREERKLKGEKIGESWGKRRGIHTYILGERKSWSV